MALLLGLDIHRQQITFDAFDPDTGGLDRGRIAPATRERLRAWLARYGGRELEVALEATTGWRFVAEELAAVGARVHLAEPAETAARRGPKRRAKTDRLDARHLRELLRSGWLPESWIPPAHILDLRSRVRLRKALVDERSGWQRRIHACLFHAGAARVAELLSGEGRSKLDRLALPQVARERVDVAMRMIEAIDRELEPLERELYAFARRQPACRALMRDYGVGALTATAVLAELGDARRFRSSRRAVRYAGLDITVRASDLHRSPGHLSRQGMPLLRWVLYEAAKSASRRGSPDHAYYQRVAARIGRRRATLSVARKLLRRAYHTLVELGEEALAVPAA